jgi:hypothetical protein
MFCQNCGKEIAEGQAFCQSCGFRLIADETPTMPDSGRYKTPWEDRETSGFFGGLARTVKDALFSPSEFFKKMPVTGGLTDPLLFAMIIGMVGLMFASVWDLLLHDSMQGFMTQEMRAAAGSSMSSGITSPLGMVMMPFLIILGLFINAGVLHLFLMMVQGAKAGFEATFRVVSYSMSAYVFMAIPFCGPLIMMVWILTLTVIGLRDAHETTGGKATAAVLFPFLFCCGMILLLTVLFMGAIVSSFGAMMQLYQ